MSISSTTEKEEYRRIRETSNYYNFNPWDYEYKNQAELNKERRDYREVLLYDRLEAAIRKINPELDEDGVYDALSQINESNFPRTLDVMDTNEKIRAKLVGLIKIRRIRTNYSNSELWRGKCRKDSKII